MELIKDDKIFKKVECDHKWMVLNSEYSWCEKCGTLMDIDFMYGDRQNWYYVPTPIAKKYLPNKNARKMIVCFELTMPNVGSWNGKWSGADKKYYHFRTMTKRDGEEFFDGEDNMSWYHNFGDGWGAQVTATQVTSQEKRKLNKISAGFAGYDWMIDSILIHGEIKND